jgi:adenylyltransferase/sulfurtransferase
MKNYADEKNYPELTTNETLRYSRHLLIPEIGLQGQRRLKGSSALVIGTGGLGSPVSMYLAAAGVGQIGLVDYDRVEFSNLQRQVVHGTSTLNQLKVESARNRLLDINPDIKVTAYNEPFTSENAMRIAESYDVVVDGTDNFPTRYLSNDVCVMLGIPNVYGAIYRFDGQASVFDARSGPCYRCIFPTPPPPGMVPTCAEGGVLGVLPGTIGTIQATEAVKLLLGIGVILSGRLLLYNALDLTFETVQLRKNPKCVVCGDEPSITELIDYEEFCGLPRHTDEVDEEFAITAVELAGRLKSDAPPRLIDVREPHEREIADIPGSESIPLGSFAGRMPELDSAGEIVLFCRTESRALRALELLLGAGFRRVAVLEGGVNAWARDVDHEQRQY